MKTRKLETVTPLDSNELSWDVGTDQTLRSTVGPKLSLATRLVPLSVPVENSPVSAG